MRLHLLLGMPASRQLDIPLVQMKAGDRVMASESRKGPSTVSPFYGTGLRGALPKKGSSVRGTLDCCSVSRCKVDLTLNEACRGPLEKCGVAGKS